MNTEGTSNQFFGVLDQLQGLWQTSNLSWHEKYTFLSKEVSPNIEPSKEWLMEVKRSSEAI
jgi:hypothetical protein